MMELEVFTIEISKSYTKSTVSCFPIYFFSLLCRAFICFIWKDSLVELFPF